MTNNEQYNKDDEFSSMVEKFSERFPNPEDYDGVSGYVAAVNGGTLGDVDDLRALVVLELEALKENLDNVKEQIDDLLKFAKENFKK